MEPRRFSPVPWLCSMRSVLPSLRRRAPFLGPLALLAACHDVPVGPTIQTPSASKDVLPAATFVVTNTADAGTGSLRQAVLDAEAAPGADIIGFTIPDTDAGCVNGTCTILLATQLEITGADAVTIDGTGSTIIVRANNVTLNFFRVLHVGVGANVILKGFTVDGGRSEQGGGGILNDGTLRVDHLVVRDNWARFSKGGGISSTGDLEVHASVVTSNDADNLGGGIYTSPTATLTMTESDVTDNSASRGGGMFTEGAVAISDSRLVGNQTTTKDGGGGGAAFDGSANPVVTMVRTLVSGNGSSQGGGIYSTDVLTIANSTISGNTASLGGGAGLALFSTTQLTHVTIVGNVGNSAILKPIAVMPVLTHSIVTASAFGETCSSPVTDNGYNIDTGTGCAFSNPTSMSNTDPMLGPLADNGGQSFTHALLDGSPALNAIPVGTNGCGTAGEIDQRGLGFARLSGAGCDIGAYEDQGPPAPGMCVVTSSGDAGAGSLREKIADPACITITFDLPLPATITLTTNYLLILRNLSIEGPGADKLTVARSSADGTPEFPIFRVTGVTASISGLTVTNGRGTNFFYAGGINNAGVLTLSRIAVIGNTGQIVGGIYNQGAAIAITHSVISNNVSGASSGGIQNAAGTMRLAQSTVSGNRASADAGGVHVACCSSAVITHSTIVGNAAGKGGGLRSTGNVTVRSSVIAGNTAAQGADVQYDFGSLAASYTLIGSPNGHTITSTPENGNLIGTSQTPLDAKLDLLTLNAPGTTATHALLKDSPAIDAGVCTDHEANAVADDQRGVIRPQGTTCDMGAYESPWTRTTTALSVSPSTQQYSDKVSLTASVLPASATGSVQFAKSVDGGTTFTDLGSPITVANGSAALNDHQILQVYGTAVRFKAVFTASGNYANSEDTENLTVTRENATIGYAAGNVAALQVSAAGGSLNANALTLSLTVKETEPDLAAATKGVGTIANAGLKVVLAPVAGGTEVELTCTASAVTGTGYAATRPYTCKNATTLPVNTYEVVATVMGDYYTGTYSDAFTVFDPSLGFASGGGSFVLGGDKVNFGFTMKYNKGGTSLQGNLIAVRHHPDGTVSRLKSNALAGLALGEDASVPMGWTSFTGKANYTKWDATAGAYVTVGNQSFSVYAEDRDNPGTGIDRIWLGAPGTLAMPGTLATAKANTAVLTGGGIAVPHKAAGGGGKK